MINEYSAKRFCCEDISLIENYNESINDESQTWALHHKLEIELNKSKQELIDLGLYYNRPAAELIFLTKSEHHRLHMNNMTNTHKLHHLIAMKTRKTHIVKDETRKKMSESHKGIVSWNKGISHSEETKRKMSESQKRIKRTWLIGQISPMKGKHHIEESNEKNRHAHLGKPAAIKGKKKVWNDESHTKYHYE
jgi:hypothetical protein